MKTPQFRTISILPKITQAQTQYYEINEEDRRYIQHWLTCFLADTAELITHNRDLSREWFRRDPSRWPKGRLGPNSMASMIGGILGQWLRNPRHDLTEAQLQPLELIFDTMQALYEDADCRPVRFQQKFIV